MLLTNVKVLSLKAVMTTGMGVPACITGQGVSTKGSRCNGWLAHVSCLQLLAILQGKAVCQHQGQS